MLAGNPLAYSLTMCFKERHIFRLLNIVPGARLLDVGCGIGYLCELGRLRGAQVYGIDVSREAVQYARREVDGRFVVANATELPYQDGLFDIIILADVIEHLADDSSALCEITRVAKPGAQVVISTPACEGLLTRTWVKTWLHGEEDTYQKNYREGYTAESLKAVMRKCHIHSTEAVYSNFFITEILLGVTKLGYALKKRHYHSQAELLGLADSLLYKLYRFGVFPVAFVLGCLEEILVHKWMKGHCLIVSGITQRPAS